MVLAELGNKIQNAISNFQQKTIAGDEEIKLMLNEIARALLAADVNISIVKKLQESVKAEVTMAGESGGLSQRKIVQSAVLNGITKILDPGVKPYVPEARGKCSVVMFVGLQGSGKTTSCTKYAYHYAKKGLKTAVICADTFRAGAYDQLKQNAAKAKVKFYGSITESDPVVIAKEGVEELKREKYQLIIVDTSGRHKQEEALFEEMKQVEDAVKPNDIVYVMSATDGQAIHDQALEFKNRVKVGSVIITKMDCHTKGGGALSAVAATKSPVAFIGVGEHVLEDFETFNPKGFVSKMMGQGDLGGLVDTIKDANIDETSETYKRLQEGQFTMRDMYEHVTNIMKLGPMGKILEMIPGMQGMQGMAGADGGTAQMKSFIHIIDSMNDFELDTEDIKKVMTPARVKRIARGCGRQMHEVSHLLMAFTKFEEVVKKIGKAGFKAMASGDPSAMMGNQGAQQMAHLSKALNPAMLKQMGGVGGLQNMMAQLTKMTGGQ